MGLRSCSNLSVIRCGDSSEEELEADLEADLDLWRESVEEEVESDLDLRRGDRLTDREGDLPDDLESIDPGLADREEELKSWSPWSSLSDSSHFAGSPLRGIFLADSEISHL